MRARDRGALAKAGKWLAGLAPEAEPGLDAQIERLFGIWACAAGMAGSHRQMTVLSRHARKLAQFDWFRYQGDPVPALAVYRAMKSTGLDHASLSALNAGYCTILRDEGTAVASKVGLVCDLLRRNGGDPVQAGERQSCFPGLGALVTAGRGEVIEVCRNVMMATSCGLLPLGGTELPVILPALAFSYARDWDIECSCALLRACAYLHTCDAPACRWARDWLLDQQQSDGRFGLMSQPGETEEGGWSLSAGPTVTAVWALAELNHTGFILGIP
jgi:hypothetical protein